MAENKEKSSQNEPQKPNQSLTNEVKVTESSIDRIIESMSLEQKIGQIILVSTSGWFQGKETQDGNAPFLRWPDPKRLLTMQKHCIGSVLSGGGGYPAKKFDDKGQAILPQDGKGNAALWGEMIEILQKYSCIINVDGVDISIPYLYGIDAVHGHGNLYGATIFPHNIGFGAAFYQEALKGGDLNLVKKAAEITAKEMAATGIFWNYAPAVSIPQDLRWGRTYEGYSDDNRVVSTLGVAYMKGLQEGANGALDLSHDHTVMATVKHYFGDGDTAWRTGEFDIKNGNGRGLDRGDSPAHKDFAYNILPYQEAITNGAQSIMISYNSWNGVKMHENKSLLSDMLLGKKGLGFEGLVVSDWDASGGDPEMSESVDKWITGINSGIDQVMLAAGGYDDSPANAHLGFLKKFIEAARAGKLKVSAINRAVRKVLTAKLRLGLFKRAGAIESLQSTIGSQEHRSIARRIVRKSQVLLKHKPGTIPLRKDQNILVYGQAANDMGLQSGGWTMEWQGKSDRVHGRKLIPGTTILDGIKEVVGHDRVAFFDQKITGKQRFSYGIAVITERFGDEDQPKTYAEYEGDREDINISTYDIRQIQLMRDRVDNLIVIIVSGRPLVLQPEGTKFDIVSESDALIAAWYPGTEGFGIADNLFGLDGTGYSGHLPFPWPTSALYNDSGNKSKIRFSRGHGLVTKGKRL